MRPNICSDSGSEQILVFRPFRNDDSKIVLADMKPRLCNGHLPYSAIGQVEPPPHISLGHANLP